MKQNKHQLEHLPTLLVQQIRLQWYKDCRGGNAAAQRNQYPRAMRLPKDFFSYYPFGLPTHFASIIQLMEYAGWYEGRSVDISIAEQYYADHGVPMMKTTQRFYRKYFGLCCEWYLAQKKLKWAADFEFALFPYLVNGIKNHLEDAYFRDMSGCELAEIEQAAGEKCQPIGHIGYYYPAEVWISEYGKLYAKYEYQDEIECFPDVFALIERELRQCKFDSAAMKTVEALDGKL